MATLPTTTDGLMQWTWPQIEPFYRDLQAVTLTAHNVRGWLEEWSHLGDHVSELRERLYVATTVNTADKAAQDRFNTFLDEIQPAAEAAEQKLKEKLLASGLEPEGFAIPLRNMRTEAAIFREANLPLLTEEDKLSTEYDKIVGAQTVTWEGKEVPLPRLQPVYQEPDRSRREQAWRVSAQRRLQDRQAINDLWRRFLPLRRKIAANADFGDDYRAYRWRQMLRFDYTPDDCKSFADAIEQVVVPAAARRYERRRRLLGVRTLRPWDLRVDPLSRSPLRPFKRVSKLVSHVSAIFHRVDPQLGYYFDIMRQDGLLDLENRKHKAPGGYCDAFARVRHPFIFMNAVGLHNDVQTLLHEGGHAFHVFETAHLLAQQLSVGMEFAEVASMGMEFLASPYLSADEGGFYTKQDAARALAEHLEDSLFFWPYMAVVDLFQHWVYENPDAAMDPAQCDAQWAQLWRRFMVGVDYSGLEQEMVTGWHNKLHIHQIPFYYVEYGLAQLGAVQVWANAQKDQQQAVASYRRALALGGTVPIPDLFAAAGARFAFDAAILRQCVGLMEHTLNKIDA